VATGDEVAAGKPSPDVYLLAAQRLGVDPTRCVAIEDSPTGCRAARAAGIAVVAVPSGMTLGMDFEPADHVVTSAAELDLVALGALVDRLRSH
jgi:riboflavin kinase